MYTSRTQTTPSQTGMLLARLALSVLLAGLLTVSAALLFITGYQILYAGVIYPGVTVGGVDVRGMTPDDASLAILTQTTYPQNGRVVFTHAGRQWLASPAQLGLLLDFDASARLAFKAGRQGNFAERLLSQFSARSGSTDIQPVFILDQEKAYQFLDAIAQEINQPVVEPTIQIDGTDVRVNPGQNGLQMDTAATLNLLTLQLTTLQDGVIPVLTAETTPIILDPTLQAEQARKMIEEPLSLSLPEGDREPETWQIEPLTLAGMLSFEKVQEDGAESYQVMIDSRALYTFLNDLKPGLYRQPVNARFMFNDNTRQLEVIEPSVTGRDLDVQASVEAIQARLRDGQHDAVLQVNYLEPAAPDTMTGADLGITELIHAETNYFYGSSAERIQNITAAAGRFHGLLVAPGETFSMADALGDISLENGYAEALIILGGQTITGVGGGVCQVSTALFRTVFFSGFPIVERHSHAYRVGYYEKIAGNIRDTNLAGLDATVFVPLVDFKFTNDSPYWLLMETYVNPTYSSLVWKFYSTSDGRSVQWQTSGITNVVEAPKPLYRESEDLPQGEVKQVDWAADGADITVQRWVYRAGQLINEDVIKTHYQPWQAIYEYGPGTEGMPPQDNGEE